MSSHRRTQILLVLALAGSLALIINQIVGQSPDSPSSSVGSTPPGKSAFTAHSATTRATTGPARGGFQLPADFAILQTHNPFGAAGASGRGRGPTGPESAFVFKGTVDAGTTMTAFIEDLGSKQVLQLGVGDSVARGKIKAIDLDGLVYAGSDTSRRIEVGQNLLGIVVPPAPPATKPSAPAARGAAGPAGAAARGSRGGTPPGLPPGAVMPQMPPGGPGGPGGPPPDAPVGPPDEQP